MEYELFACLIHRGSA